MPIKGLKQVNRKLKRLQTFRPMSVDVMTKKTTGTYKRAGGKTKEETRSLAKNLVIVRTQAKAGRNIAFFDDSTILKYQLILANWRKDLIGKSLSVKSARKEIKKLGDVLVRSIEDHIRASKAEGGMKPVKESTQKRKDKEGVRSNLPPLYRTGQLLKAFRAKIKWH